MQELLEELYEKVVKHDVRTVPKPTIKYYHYKVFNEYFNLKCSMCYTEAHLRLKEWYRKNIVKYDTDNIELYKEKLYKLKMLLKFNERENNYELCEFIKGRIEIIKQKIDAKNNSNTQSK